MFRLTDMLPGNDTGRRARAGGLARRTSEVALRVILPAFLPPSRVGQDAAGRGGADLTDLALERGEHTARADYRSVSFALTHAALPDDVEVDPAAASWVRAGLAPAGCAVGTRLRLAEDTWGRVRSSDAPLWLQIGSAAPEGFYGAIEIVPDPGSGTWVTQHDLGAPIFTDDDHLIAFVVACDGETCMAAPAATFLKERGLVEADGIDIKRHNLAAAQASVKPALTIHRGLQAFGARVAMTPSTFGRTAEAVR